ncbi:Oidioi.mRNA.OKI2018_I69.chr2.g5551.t1.cds [Oikopleura dioica]|uniref:Oidioi.mRNA.OKI2018_I69.chr2.g5551.t1.cds n=1 Tax=Oikopleura dioica TaxID=34765 RepID=A0ABN7T3Y7_OIKDI|nr:Oidioi.mRNA.OKI2018_I69.chr2.g5551.t1.cds [Oikopleura dioica]
MYARNHNIMTNMAPVCGGEQWRKERENITFAKYLHDFDYKTAMFGKYLNEYDGSYVPTGWDTWHGLVHNSRYYNYKVRVHGWSENNTDIQDPNNSFIEKHKDLPLDYFTGRPDVIANRSSQWVQDQHRLDPDSPKLLVVNFPAPHGPADAAPRHTDEFEYHDESHLKKSGAFNNVDDNENRNWFLRDTKEKLTTEEQQFGGQLRRKRLQFLKTARSGAINFLGNAFIARRSRQKVYFTFKNLGILEKTYMIFTSDHGFHIGQFGMVKGKSTPYEFDVRVPMYVLGKDIKRTTQSNVVLNIDLAPTILGLAYLMPPKHMDGMSMAGVWRGKYEQTRDQFIIEKHASIISRGSAASAVARFDKDKQIREFCSQMDEPLGSCSAEKEYKCSQNEETGKWKVQTCKLPGFIHPGTGQCNCDEEWVNKIKPNRRPQRDTARKTDSSSKVSRSRQKRRNHKNDRRSSHPSRKSRRKMKDALVAAENDDQKGKIGSINDLKACSIQENRVSCDHVSPREWRQDLNLVKERIEMLNQEMQFYEQAKKQLLQQKKERKLSDFQKTCKKDGMSCFTVDDKYWTVEPTWKGDPQCHCSMTSVQGYSCLRKIGAETRSAIPFVEDDSSEDMAYDNFIYCEFYLHQRKSENPDDFEVFYEYYDLDEDEDQLLMLFKLFQKTGKKL